MEDGVGHQRDTSGGWPALPIARSSPARENLLSYPPRLHRRYRAMVFSPEEGFGLSKKKIRGRREWAWRGKNLCPGGVTSQLQGLRTPGVVVVAVARWPHRTKSQNQRASPCRRTPCRPNPIHFSRFFGRFGHFPSSFPPSLQPAHANDRRVAAAAERCLAFADPIHRPVGCSRFPTRSTCSRIFFQKKGLFRVATALVSTACALSSLGK